MKSRVALAAFGGLSMACGGIDAHPPPVVANSSWPTDSWPTEGPPTIPYDSTGVPVGGALVEARNLQVAGYLDGRLHGIRLAGDTTQNYGLLEEWEGQGAYLNASVAVGGPEGAGMIIVWIDGGMNHPIFTEGSWQSAQFVDPMGGSPNLISVSSCAGPTLGEWPYEQTAVSYEMNAELDPEVPGAVVLAIDASFYTDESSTQTSDVAAVIRLSPEGGAEARERPQLLR